MTYPTSVRSRSLFAAMSFLSCLSIWRVLARGPVNDFSHDSILVSGMFISIYSVKSYYVRGCPFIFSLVEFYSKFF